MSEGMSAEAEEQIRYIASMDAPGPFSEKAVNALRVALAEVDRLRAHLAAEHLATEAAETENDQLRARLAEIGETREEWTVVRRWRRSTEFLGLMEEDEALALVAENRANRISSTVNRRLAGEWREVPDA
jgi:hypothetical protein